MADTLTSYAIVLLVLLMLMVLIYIIRKKYNGNESRQDSFSSTNKIPVLESMIFPKKRTPPEVIGTGKGVKILLEVPIDRTNEIKIETRANQLQVRVDAEEKNYLEIIDLPPEASIQIVKSSLTNGLLELTLKRKAEVK